MTTGRNYAKKMDEAIARLGHDHDAKATELDALNRELAELHSSVAQAYMAIAREHVAALDGHELKAYDEITEEAAFRVRHRLQEIGQLKAVLGKRVADEERASARHDQAVELRDRNAAKVRALEKVVDADLASQGAYVELTAAERTAAGIAERAKEKARLATEESAQKAIAYEADPIFMYLHRRGFGSSEYRRKTPHLIRVVDGWLARLCAYATASRDYLTLTTMPSYLDEHADKMQREAQVESDRAAAFRRRVLKEEGIDALIEALRESDRLLADCDATLATAREALDSTRLALHLVEEWRDEASEALLQRMARTFSQEGYERLRDRVSATSTPDDDANLARIEAWRVEIEDRRSRVADVRTYIQAISDRTKALVDLRRQYKQKGYDSSDYKISGGKVDDLLTGYILGTVLGGDLWRGISTSVRYDPPYTPSSSTSSSGFGGGGFRSGGSFGGGSFRTGGGF